MTDLSPVPGVQRRDELERILALPKRPPLDCERQGLSRRWAPAAQALVEVVTARYTRGPRLACGCRDRRLIGLPGGRLVVYQKGRPGGPPPLPVETTVEAFCRDNSFNADVVKLAQGLRAGAEAELPGLGTQYCITELNPVQSWILWELAQPSVNGIFGMISVGGGKTAAGILAPLARPHIQKVCLLAKPDQRLHYRDAYLRLREHFVVPSIVFDKPDMRGASFIVGGVPVVHFRPYSLLSSPKSTQLLEQLDPGMIIGDEIHLLASKKSSRTMRWLRLMNARPDTVFCGWSGSTIKKSIRDAAHLVAHALGMGSPYPIPDDDVEAWSSEIDPSYVESNSALGRRLRKAFGSGDERSGIAELFSDDTVRNGFRERVIWTPGVISTKSSSVACSITLRERHAPPMPKTLQEALKSVRLGQRPDGEEIAEQDKIKLCARNVAAGYHFYWAFPKSTDEERAEGGLVDQWYEARKAWGRELRAKLLEGAPHLDSPMLCANAAERAWRVPRYEGDLPVWHAQSWPAWAAIEALVEPDPRVKWLDDYLAQDAAKWAMENVGIVWCLSSAFGRRVAQLAGINYHGGGPDAEARILAEDGKRSIVASIKAHGESRDGLQYKFWKQLLAELPVGADRYEQLFGRLARVGQPEDTVETEVYRHTAEYREALQKAFMYAEFIEATTPNRQLLLAADRDFDL